jgi:hypothetical protein
MNIHHKYPKTDYIVVETRHSTNQPDNHCIIKMASSLIKTFSEKENWFCIYEMIKCGLFMKISCSVSYISIELAVPDH